MKTRLASNVNYTNSVAILNELFAKLDCSLARYLSYARPWVRRRYMLLEALVRRLSYEHEIFAKSISRLIDERRGAVSSCVFPMGFTSYNDVSLEYLAPKLLEHERALIVTAEGCAKRLENDPEARRVVEKLVTSLRRYATLLAELLAPTRMAPPTAEDEVTSLPHKAASWATKERVGLAVAESQTAA